MGHYFINDPSLKSNIRPLKMTILQKEYTFFTDDGIFSKNELDDGTLTLIKTVHREKIHGRCLDFGCANGIVGVVLKDFFPETVFDLVDINQRALALAKRNVDYYNQTNSSVFYSDGFKQNDHSYDYIFINPPIRAGKDVVYAMYEDSHAHLNQNGIIYVVIRKSHGAMSSKDKLMQLFQNCDIMKRNRGFYVLKSIKNQE